MASLVEWPVYAISARTLLCGASGIWSCDAVSGSGKFIQVPSCESWAQVNIAVKKQSRRWNEQKAHYLRKVQQYVHCACPRVWVGQASTTEPALNMNKGPVTTCSSPFVDSGANHHISRTMGPPGLESPL